MVDLCGGGGGAAVGSRLVGDVPFVLIFSGGPFVWPGRVFNVCRHGAFSFGDLIEGKTDWLGVILLLFITSS